MSENELIVVRTFDNMFQAEVAKSALDAAGIDSLLRSDDAGGMRPHLWETRGVELIVRAEEADRAREVLTTAARIVRPPSA